MENSSTDKETDQERRERVLQLCREWWQSPAGREAIRNAKYPKDIHITKDGD